MSKPAALIKFAFDNTTAIRGISPNDREDGLWVKDSSTGQGWTFDADSAAAAGAGVLVPLLGDGRWIADTSVAGAVATTDLASTSNGYGASLVGIEDASTRFTGTDVEAALGEVPTSAELASTSNGEGAALVGIEDAGTFTAATDVEAALAELYQHLFSATGGCVPIQLSAFREVSATGDVGDAAAIGGVLASDTTPILLGLATTNDWSIQWATTEVDPIGCSFMLPPDFDGTANATLDLVVASGSSDAATFAVYTSWDGGAEVTDSADDSGTKSATAHTISATIAAADIPDVPKRVTFRLTPGAHATNAINLLGARLTYKRKLLTA